MDNNLNKYIFELNKLDRYKINFDKDLYKLKNRYRKIKEQFENKLFSYPISNIINNLDLKHNGLF